MYFELTNQMLPHEAYMMEAADCTHFRDFHEYDFESNVAFQKGWQQIAQRLREETDADAGSQLLKAKAFFYSRFHKPIDVDKYKQWLLQNVILTEGNTCTEDNSVHKDPKSKEICSPDKNESGSTELLPGTESSKTRLKVPQSSDTEPFQTDLVQCHKENSKQLTDENDEVKNIQHGAHFIDSHHEDTSTQTNDDNPIPKYPASFVEIMHLVDTGQPIPGVVDLNIKSTDSEPTVSHLKRKPKPWEG
ncbi:uncharacterized protein LOC106169647 [Lingula anatina]|uniref:Uncharacterized protein LOC106169647 n=1 Tax=Lingula anatina TaxID=7574 RepID=A0A1S3J311_LINAN|nr:uncharacterized protein LOC106169647 [Lingula anatina]|eukprot:XP_013404633.1 uncharacterized protein LOC106169647 [Lingula anatina]